MNLTFKKYVWWIIPIAMIGVFFAFFQLRTTPEEKIAIESIELSAMKYMSMGNEILPAQETQHIPYNSTPPTSGPHIEMLAAWGIHKTPIANEMQVANLETGGVLIQYKPGKVTPEEIVQLEKIAEKNGRKKIIVAPYDDMGYSIALTAWVRLFPMESIEEENIIAFIVAYEGKEHSNKK